jgi:hypothetical protein
VGVEGGVAPKEFDEEPRASPIEDNLGPRIDAELVTRWLEAPDARLPVNVGLEGC